MVMMALAKLHKTFMKKARRLGRKCELPYINETPLSGTHATSTSVGHTALVDPGILFPPNDRYNFDKNKE